MKGCPLFSAVASGHQRDLGPLHDVLFHGPSTAAHPIAPERSAGRLIATLVSAGAASALLELVRRTRIGSRS